MYIPWSQLWALTFLSSPQLREPPPGSPLLGSPSRLSPFLLSCRWPPWNIHYKFILCLCYSAFLSLLGFPCRICVCGWNLRALGYRHAFVFSVSKATWEPRGRNERYQVHKEGADREGGRCSVSGGEGFPGSVSKKNTMRAHCLPTLPDTCLVFILQLLLWSWIFFPECFWNSDYLEVGDNLFSLMEIWSTRTTEWSLLGQRKI